MDVCMCDIYRLDKINGQTWSTWIVFVWDRISKLWKWRQTKQTRETLLSMLLFVQYVFNIAEDAHFLSNVTCLAVESCLMMCLLYFLCFQSANPYIVKLSILDDELALTVCPWKCLQSNMQIGVLHVWHVINLPPPPKKKRKKEKGWYQSVSAPPS